MDEPQSLPLWAIPLMLLGFAGFWTLIVGLIGMIGGWTGLGALFREPPDAPRPTAQAFSMSSLDLRGPIGLPMNYNNCVIVALGDVGIHLRTWLPFRFGHPPLLIPWSEIESAQVGRAFLRRATTVSMRGTDTRVRIYGAAGRAVAEAWERYRAWAARSGGT
jgi:hypothetical protein